MGVEIFSLGNVFAFTSSPKASKYILCEILTQQIQETKCPTPPHPLSPSLCKYIAPSSSQRHSQRGELNDVSIC